MNIYAVKFEYDNGDWISNEICFIFAESEKEAMEIFKNKIHLIFCHNEDICIITTITKIPNDTKLLYTRNSTMWGCGNHKFIW